MGLSGKESACHAEDTSLIPGSGRQEDSLQKRMATHSSILAWEIPWTEEPGGLQPWGRKRVGHNLETKTTTIQAETHIFLIKRA